MKKMFAVLTIIAMVTVLGLTTVSAVGEEVDCRGYGEAAFNGEGIMVGCFGPSGFTPLSELMPLQNPTSAYLAQQPTSTPEVFQSVPLVTPEATPEAEMVQQTQPAWLQNLSTRDAQCASSVFTQYGVEPVHIPMAGGEDGSPSPTLALVGILQQGPSEIEVDRYEGRLTTIRGGEDNQIQRAVGRLVFVPLMDNAQMFADYWSRPENGVVDPNGEALGSVGIEVRTGTAQVTVDLYRDGSLVANAAGLMRPQQNVGTVFVDLPDNRFEIAGLGNWGAGNLRGFAVPIHSTGCYYFDVSAQVPQHAILEVGVGTFQVRYSGVAELVIPSQPIQAQEVQSDGTPSTTPIPEQTSCEAGEELIEISGQPACIRFLGAG